MEKSSALEPQEQFYGVELEVEHLTIGLVKGDRPIPGVLLFTPEAVQRLTDLRVHVYVQRSYAAHTQYTDMDYANAGAEIIEDFASLASLSKMLVKFSPFKEEELSQMRPGTLVLSRVLVLELTARYMELMKEKRAYGFAINLVTDQEGNSMIDNILMSSVTAETINKRLASFIQPLVETLVFSSSIRILIQTNPSLLQSVYCCEGVLCNKTFADLLDVMWKDILSLCFDMN